MYPFIVNGSPFASATIMSSKPIECERWQWLYTDLLARRRRLSAAIHEFRGALDEAYLQRLQTVALLNEVKRRATAASGARLLPICFLGYQLASMIP